METVERIERDILKEDYLLRDWSEYAKIFLNLTIYDLYKEIKFDKKQNNNSD